MKALYRILLYWYRTRLLRYRPIYDTARAEALLAEIHQNLTPFLAHPDETLRYVAASRGHYVAQSRQRPLYSRIVLEILCAAMLLPALGYWWARAPKVKPQKQTLRGMRVVYGPRALAIVHLPSELEASCEHTLIPAQRYLRAHDIHLLAHAAWLMMRQLRVRFKDRHFSGLIQHWFKLAAENARLRPVLDICQTRYIAVYAEYDCALSYLTLLCHRENVSLYNIIHGDHLMDVANPFFQVDRCYTWHPFYNALFVRQHVQADFRLFTNPNFSMTEEEARFIPCGVGVIMPHPIYSSSDAAYAEELRSFVEVLNRLASEREVTLRPHPLHPECYNQIRPLLSSAVHISDPHQEPVRKFIVRHESIIGVYSALLIEATMMGREVIVIENDATRQIAQYHYWFACKNVKLLPISQLVDALAPILQPTGVQVPESGRTDC